MLIYIIVPSINPLVNLKDFNCEDENVKVIVVDEGDEKIRKKNSEILSSIMHEYYGPKERKQWFKGRFGGSFEKYYNLIPKRCHAESSFGFLKAYEDQADVIIELDDDVYISKNFLKEHLSNLFGESGVTVQSKGGWYNTMDNLLLNVDERIFPRGHPYMSPCRDEDYAWTEGGGKCLLNMGLWRGQPDLDALTLIHYGGIDGRSKVESRGLRIEKVVLGKGVYFSVCSMNTSFLSKAVPAFYQLYMNYMGVDRFDDIWSGVFLKRISDQIGDKICLGKPLELHVKRPRNVFNDLKKEVNGLYMNEHVWRICEEAELSAKTYSDCYLELADFLARNIERCFKDKLQIKFWNAQIKNMRMWVEVTDKIR
jgi:hypothetical protein